MADAPDVEGLRRQVVAAELIAAEREARLRELGSALASEQLESARLTAARLLAFEETAVERGVAAAASVAADASRDAAAALTAPVPLAAAATAAVARRVQVRQRMASVLGPRVPFFDPAWYVVNHPEVATSRLGPLLHYRRHGSRHGWSPHPLFDTDWYRHHATTLRDGDDLVEHYLDEGAAAGFDPHPLFDSDWYADRHGLRGGENPLVHYLGAWRNGASPHALFLVPWYLVRHPEMAASGVEPLQHFVQRGAAARYNPHPLFDLDWYLSHSPDVARSGINPLVHYVLHGWREGRDPHRLFEGLWYRRHYGVDVDPLRHYLDVGAAAGNDPGRIFETSWYVRRHPEAARSGRNPLAFFVEVGLRRGDVPSQWAADLGEPVEPLVRARFVPPPLPPSPFAGWGQTSASVGAIEKVGDRPRG